jgi:hypothetical protein
LDYPWNFISSLSYHIYFIIYHVVGLYRLSKTYWFDFFCRITSPFFVLHHTFFVLHQHFGIIFTLFVALLHLFGIIPTLLVVLHHPFAITSYVTNSVNHLHSVIVDSCKPRITQGWIQNVVNFTNNQQG